MRLELTENAKKFIETLPEEDLAKVTFTEDAMESTDESISNNCDLFFPIGLNTVKTLCSPLTSYCITFLTFGNFNSDNFALIILSP